MHLAVSGNNKDATEQISYERSSQAQRLTCTPHLIFADCGGLLVDMRRMAFEEGTGQRGGVMIGYEQSLHRKVKFVTDWYSGNNRFGYVTPGLAFTTSKTSAFYAGYSIGNNGRKNNALFLYYGITF